MHEYNFIGCKKKSATCFYEGLVQWIAIMGYSEDFDTRDDWMTSCRGVDQDIERESNMVVSSYFHLLLLASLAVLNTDAYLRKYAPLIIGLHQHYRRSSVLIVMPDSNEHTKENMVPFILTRELSRKGILSSIINSEEALKYIDKYENQEVGPLVVVMMTAVQDIDSFVSNKEIYDILDPIWLVIFTDEFGVSICDDCNEPTKNIFGLRFDTEMLIVCCKNESLQEWWSDHRNRTETMAIGEWSVNDGLISITNQSLYARRSEVKGADFRIGFVTNSAFYLEEKNGHPAGLFNSLLMELAYVMNFNNTRIFKREGFGSWDLDRYSWSGVIELIDKDRVDLGVGEFSMLLNRLEVVDFTLPVMITSELLYFKATDNSVVQWSAHFKAFSIQIWIMIILIIILSPILITLIQIRTGDDSFRNHISEHYLNVWGIFCQQGLAVFPTETPMRIAYYSIVIPSFVVSAAYSACLISFMVESKTSVPFTSVKDFANDGTYDLTVLKHSSEWDLFQSSSDPDLVKMRYLLKPWNKLPHTMKEAFDEVCKGKVAFCLSEIMVTTGMDHYPCEIAHIDMGSTDSYAMTLKTGSEYTGVISYHIQRFHENGILHRLKQKYLPIPSKPETVMNEVTFWGVAPMLLALAGGMIFSLSVMLGEKIYAMFRKVERKRWISERQMIHFRKLKILGGLNNNKKHQRNTKHHNHDLLRKAELNH